MIWMTAKESSWREKSRGGETIPSRDFFVLVEKRAIANKVGYNANNRGYPANKLGYPANKACFTANKN